MITGAVPMLRFAPSPTGDMHIETLRVAIVNYIVAKQKGDKFLIRIDDGDKERNIEGKDTEILQILEKFALTHDAVFHQSEHLNIHQTLAIRLLEEEKAFICTCAPGQTESGREEAEVKKTLYRCSGHCYERDKAELKKLKEEKSPFVIRIKKPDGNIVNHDIIQGEIVTAASQTDSFVILHADGTPAYDFACACDDMLSGVDCIIREEKHLLHTPGQEYIKKQLGYATETHYAHLPSLMVNHENEKDHTLSVKALFEEGFIPDAIANYLISLGNEVPKDVFTLPEALAWFTLENISKSPVTFDRDRLRYLNRKHLERIDDKRLSMVFGFADEAIGKLAKLYLQEASTLNELERKIQAIFSPKDFNGIWGKQMRILENIIARAPMIETFDTFTLYLMQKSSLRGEALSKPLRLLMTGREEGPELSDIYPHIKSYLLEVAS